MNIINYGFCSFSIWTECVISLFAHFVWLCGPRFSFYHKLNMDLDLQSSFRFHVFHVHSWDPPTPPPPIPPHMGSFTRAILVYQDRRHLFVTLGFDHIARIFWEIFEIFCSDAQMTVHRAAAVESASAPGLNPRYFINIQAPPLD